MNNSLKEYPFYQKHFFSLNKMVVIKLSVSYQIVTYLSYQNGRYQFVVTNLSLLQATKLSLPKSACRVNIIEIFILNVGGKSLPCIIVFEPLVSGRVGNTGQSLPVLDEGVIVAGIGLTAVYHHTDQVVVNSSEKNTEFKQFLQINQSGFRIRSLGFGFGSIVTV